MSKLQNNFTTPEQSKRLLELGVPADSADCFWFDERDIMFLKDELYSDEAKDGEFFTDRLEAEEAVIIKALSLL